MLPPLQLRFERLWGVVVDIAVPDDSVDLA